MPGQSFFYCPKMLLMTFVLFCCIKLYIGVVIRTLRSCGLGLATTNREALGKGISEIMQTRCSFYRILFIKTGEKVAMFIVVESLTSLQWLHNSPAHSPTAVLKPENTTTPTVGLWKLQHQGPLKPLRQMSKLWPRLKCLARQTHGYRRRPYHVITCFSRLCQIRCNRLGLCSLAAGLVLTPYMMNTSINPPFS